MPLAKYLAALNVVVSKVNYTEVHPNYLLRQRLLAGVVRDVGRFEEAEHWLKKILRVCSQESIPDSAVVFGIKLELSTTYRQLGTYAKAEESALEVFEHFRPGGSGDKGSKLWLPAAQTSFAAPQKLGGIEKP